jgi:hypothetical protein
VFLGTVTMAWSPRSRVLLCRDGEEITRSHRDQIQEMMRLLKTVRRVSVDAVNASTRVRVDTCVTRASGVDTCAACRSSSQEMELLSDVERHGDVLTYAVHVDSLLERKVVLIRDLRKKIADFRRSAPSGK